MKKAPRKMVAAKGDVIGQAWPWSITCNDPGHSMFVQYDGGKKRFLTHKSAASLAGAILEALRRDPVAALAPMTDAVEKRDGW